MCISYITILLCIHRKQKFLYTDLQMQIVRYMYISAGKWYLIAGSKLIAYFKSI